MFQTKVVGKIKTHILCSVTSYFFIFFENRAVYMIMWQHMVDRGRQQVTIWRMRIACWIPKATDTHSEYVTLIPFPLKQWLRERASLIHYTYIACVVLTDILGINRSHIISKPTLSQKPDLFILSEYIEKIMNLVSLYALL